MVGCGGPAKYGVFSPISLIYSWLSLCVNGGGVRGGGGDMW